MFTPNRIIQVDSILKTQYNHLNFIRVVAYSTFLILSLRIFYHLINGTDAYLTVPVDDFYYYFTVGKNISTTLHSTFDGVTTTNGYHPLWLLIITGMQYFSRDINLFFAGLAIVCLICSIFTFELSYSLLFKILTPNSASYAILLFMSISYGWMTTWSMEVTIAIPLYLYTLIKFPLYLYSTQHKPSLFFRFGIVVSLLTLSRIDLLMFCGMLLIIFYIHRRKYSDMVINELFYVFLGCLPILIYFSFNLIYHDSLFPISAVSKQLTKHFGFNPHLVSDLQSFREGYIAIIIIPIAILIMFVLHKKIQPIKMNILLYVGLMYPIIYFLVYGFQSDWIIFIWYQFTLPVAIAFSGYILYECVKEYFVKIPDQFMRSILSLSVCAIMLPKIVQTTYSQTVEWYQHPGSIYTHAKSLSQFTNSHPGLYAMGDRAGLTQYIIQQPVIQLEGLMADGEFLNNIRNENNLLSVLTSLHVDYLILSKFTELKKTKDGFYIEIPFKEQAGDRSKKMSTYLDKDPVFFIVNSGSIVDNKKDNSILSVYTYVFKISE